ncbi:MAG: ABC transporter ATP-binding protein [Anaerolineales bacterium]|jgi:putative spermidine/putrescine transport system ATP-binding protein|nr:ABC transporter ATP-binding protein [Anaerolineales bacterium]
MAYLDLIDISKDFSGGRAQGTTVAVKDFNLSIERGELVSFLGPSGCGKTTTLRMVAGFETPSRGAIKLNGEDISRRPPNQRHVGMVFQAYALFPNMTVADNIGFGLRIAKKPKEEMRNRVDEMLGLIRMPELGDRYPYQLSGGQQQRVALARALAVQPAVLLLDEPLSALDAKIRVELRSEIRRIQQQLGITTIYVTHDQEEALSISDRVVVMNAGMTEQVGKPFEIYNYPATSFVASFVGTLNQLRCTVADAEKGKLAYDSQQFTTSSPVRGARGATVTVMLRPEELRFGAQEGENSLTGKVETVTFLGAIVRIRVNMGTALVIVDALNERTLKLPEVGQTQTVSFPPHACWVMAET